MPEQALPLLYLCQRAHESPKRNGKILRCTHPVGLPIVWQYSAFFFLCHCILWDYSAGLGRLSLANILCIVGNSRQWLMFFPIHELFLGAFHLTKKPYRKFSPFLLRIVIYNTLQFTQYMGAAKPMRFKLEFPIGTPTVVYHYAFVILEEISLSHANMPALFADMLVGVHLSGNIIGVVSRYTVRENFQNE